MEPLPHTLPPGQTLARWTRKQKFESISSLSGRIKRSPDGFSVCQLDDKTIRVSIEWQLSTSRGNFVINEQLICDKVPHRNRLHIMEQAVAKIKLYQSFFATKKLSSWTPTQADLKKRMRSEPIYTIRFTDNKKVTNLNFFRTTDQAAISNNDRIASSLKQKKLSHRDFILLEKDLLLVQDPQGNITNKQQVECCYLSMIKPTCIADELSRFPLSQSEYLKLLHNQVVKVISRFHFYQEHFTPSPQAILNKRKQQQATLSSKMGKAKDSYENRKGKKIHFLPPSQTSFPQELNAKREKRLKQANKANATYLAHLTSWLQNILDQLHILNVNNDLTVLVKESIFTQSLTIPSLSIKQPSQAPSIATSHDQPIPPRRNAKQVVNPQLHECRLQ